MDKDFIEEIRGIVGDDGVRATDAQRHVYAFDAFTLEKGLPGVVALPRSTDEVIAIAKLCHQRRVPMVPRGSGTGLAGGSMAHPDEVLVCLSRMNRILQIDLPNRRMRAQA